MLLCSLIFCFSDSVDDLTLMFPTSERRMIWEATFNEAKQKLALLCERLAPEFTFSLPVRNTRAGLQVFFQKSFKNFKTWEQLSKLILFSFLVPHLLFVLVINLDKSPFGSATVTVTLDKFVYSPLILVVIQLFHLVTAFAMQEFYVSPPCLHIICKKILQ